MSEMSRCTQYLVYHTHNFRHVKRRHGNKHVEIEKNCCVYYIREFHLFPSSPSVRPVSNFGSNIAMSYIIVVLTAICVEVLLVKALSICNKSRAANDQWECLRSIAMPVITEKRNSSTWNRERTLGSEVFSASVQSQVPSGDACNGNDYL
jgi:hypothetical protein